MVAAVIVFAPTAKALAAIGLDTVFSKRLSSVLKVGEFNSIVGLGYSSYFNAWFDVH